MSDSKSKTVNKSTAEEKVEDSVDAFTRCIIKNDVVFREISSYLSVGDLKQLSQVNKTCLRSVRLIPRFISNFGRKLRRRFNEMKSPIIRRGIVHLNEIGERDLEIFRLQRYKMPELEYLEIQRSGRMSDDSRCSILKQILLSCPKLRTLAFGRKQFLGKDYHKLFGDEQVKQWFSELSELYIGVRNEEYDDEESDHESDGIDNEEGGCKVFWGKENEIRLEQSFSHMSRLGMKLKKFSYKETERMNNLLSIPFCYPGLILGSSVQTLTHLNLKLKPILEILISLSTMKFPKLKCLKLYFSCTFEKPNVLDIVLLPTVVPFVQSHIRKLKELSLNSERKYSLKPFRNILAAFPANVIHKLEFKSSQGFTEEGHDWSFLEKGCRYLNHFKIHTRKLNLKTISLVHERGELVDSDVDESDVNPLESDQSDEDDGPSNQQQEDNDVILLDENDLEVIVNPVEWSPPHLWLRYLNYLPSTVIGINLGGMKGYEGEGEQDADRVEAFDLSVSTSLERFTNLTQLTMVKTTSFLTNSTLQFICSHLITLRIFRCDFDGINDFGISGVREVDGVQETIGVSLKNLKCLKELYMEFSRLSQASFSWVGFLESVQFLELTRLYVGASSLTDSKDNGFENSSEDGPKFLQLLQQNPSLERIHLDFYKPRYWVLQESKKIHPRVKLDKKYNII